MKEKLTKDELRAAAFRILRKLGYKYEDSDKARSISYDIFNTDAGIKKVSLITRNYISSHRYPLGLRPELFGSVEEFILYFHREDYIYFVPKEFIVEEIYNRIEKPSINSSVTSPHS